MNEQTGSLLSRQSFFCPSVSRVLAISLWNAKKKNNKKKLEFLKRGYRLSPITIKQKQRQVFGEVLVALQRVSVCFTCPFRPIGTHGHVEFYLSRGEVVIAVVMWNFHSTVGMYECGPGPGPPNTFTEFFLHHLGHPFQTN